LLFKTNRFSRLFPTIGSQIITEPRSLEDFPCLERTSCPTDGATVAASKTIASQFLRALRMGAHPGATTKTQGRPDCGTPDFIRQPCEPRVEAAG
jgi:hypothetical protein